MAKSFIKKLVASMENDGMDNAEVELVEGSEMTEDGTKVIIIENPESVETAVEVVRESEDEVTEAADGKEVFEDVVEGLESILNAFNGSEKEGGLTPREAKFMRISVESYLNRIDMIPEVASLENFGGTSSRMKATEISMEGIKEQIAKIWEYIKETAKRVLAAALEFLKSVFTALGRLKKSAEQLKALAGKIKGEPKSEKFKVDMNLVKKLYTPDNTALENFGKVSTGIVGFTKDLMEVGVVNEMLVVDKLTDIVGLTESNDYSDLENKLKQILNASVVPKVFSVGKINGKSGFVSDTMIGGVKFGIIDENGKFKASKEMIDIEVKEGSTFTTLNSSEMKLLSDNVLKSIVNINSSISHLDKAIKTVEKFKPSKKFEESAKPEDIKTFNKAMRLWLGELSAFAHLNTMMTSHSVGILNACLKLGFKSAAQYSNVKTASESPVKALPTS